MVLDSAIVVLAGLLNIADVGASERARAPAGAVATPVKVAAKPRWPAKKSKPRQAVPRQAAPRREIDEREEELLKSPSRTRTGSRDQAAEEAEEEDPEESEAEEEEEEEKPKATKHAQKRSAEEEDDEDEDVEPLTSLPPVLPRLVRFAVGGSVLRRAFSYASALQGDADLPRFGYSAALEAYPLLRMASALRMLGLGAWYEKEYGTAGSSQTDGSTISFPVSHGRWGFDLRYAFLLGDRVVLAPALGFGKTTVDLGRNMPVAPLMCPATPASTPPCFADVNTSHMIIDLHLRIAATPALALFLDGGYLPGLSAIADASMAGFHAQLGASLLVNDILALQASIPYWRYGYSFSTPAGGMPTPAATDQYYGLVLGVAVMTPR